MEFVLTLEFKHNKILPPSNVIIKILRSHYHHTLSLLRCRDISTTF